MILSVGEILADLIGEYDGNNVKYERFVGGAPLNVAVGIKRLGGKVGFVGSVGDDIIGHYLYDFCNDLQLDYLDIYLDPKHNTTLAFVENDPDGERSFCFFRQNTADYQIDYDRLEVIKDFDIIHLGSLMLREEIGRKVADSVIELAKKHHKLVSFDINYRDDIYESSEVAKSIYLKYIQKADILKFSIDEVELFTNKKDLDGLNTIVNPNQLVFVTLGSNGSYYQYQDNRQIVPSVKIKPIDTTGAGDAFYACVLKHLDEVGMDLDSSQITEIMAKANRAGALACSKKGALTALPTQEELEKLD